MTVLWVIVVLVYATVTVGIWRTTVRVTREEDLTGWLVAMVATWPLLPVWGVVVRVWVWASRGVVRVKLWWVRRKMRRLFRKLEPYRLVDEETLHELMDKMLRRED